MNENGQTLIERHGLTLEHGSTNILEEGLSSDILRVNTIDDKTTSALLKDIEDNQEVATTVHVIFKTDKHTYLIVTGEF